MADTYTLKVALELAIASLGGIQVAPLQPTGTPAYSVTRIALASGNNTISIPSSVNWCLITFDPACATTRILKGVNGDTGITLSIVSPGIVLLPVTAGGTFVINSSALDPTFTQFTFF